MDISVIICTYNRAESLRRTLQTCCDLVIPAGVTWELLVVDNNSSDQTKSVCQEFAANLPLRYIFEPQAGKSFALNRAIQEAQGDLLFFTDDDVDLPAEWLTVGVATASKHPDASFIGGRVIPRWETPPPPWMVKYSATWLSAVAVHQEKGATERFLSKDEAFFGANVIFRRKVFTDGVAFHTAIGPQPGSEVRGEDTELMQRLMIAGHTALYTPSLVVYHRNPSYRASESYLWNWFKGQGIKEARLAPVGTVPGIAYWGVPRYLWKQALITLPLLVVARCFCSFEQWLPLEIRTARICGMIGEYRRQARTEKRRSAQQQEAKR